MVLVLRGKIYSFDGHDCDASQRQVSDIADDVANDDAVALQTIVARRTYCNSYLWDTLSLNELRPLFTNRVRQKREKREIKEPVTSHTTTVTVCRIPM